ncbi:hypothetical protein C1M56_06635 [Vibrio diazotrophicus]|nr:hypothetical protein C1M56_06635 [Vibrio diazotrophicus]
MGSILKFVLINNVLSIAIVVMIEKLTFFFGIRYLSDYAFYVLVLQWGMAVLFFLYPPGGLGQSDDLADSITSSMVDGSATDLVDDDRYSKNTVFCLKLFISGIPSFLICLLISYIS